MSGARSMRMTRAEIVRRLRDRVGLSRTDAVDCLETVLVLIRRTLVDGGDVRLSGFGQFSARQRAGRMGVHPSTGKPVEHKARLVATFKPARALKDLIDYAPSDGSDPSFDPSR